ncbi:LOW QUALITY PROTEIN: integrin alpha-L-like, partial [Mantella aurantiaca]
CQKDEVDLCFLFDGSASSGLSELRSIQHFLRDAIKHLRNTTMHLAIVQFSSTVQTELDFTQYQTFSNLTEVINSLTLLDGGTNTFLGINHTLHNVFTEKAGHRPRAKKVLLILTDGEANDNEGDIISQSEKMGVKRYLIGVGNNFNRTAKALEFVNVLSSDPNEMHTMLLENFKKLESLFTKLQQRIMNIEGVQTCSATSRGACSGLVHTSSFSRELSSAGLSAALTQEQRFLGDPGIFDWSGGLLDISGTEKLINISLQEDDKYGYLGYSVEVIEAPEGILYVAGAAGAPRHRYVGLVTVFQETPNGTKSIQKISGEQVGSYFGSEIEVCDVDQDGLSDVVLIAAPHFYDARWSGQVSVYHYIQGVLRLRVTLHGESGYLHSQFGAALSALGDLDGDDIGDVAVGAPYEMEGRGAVYIFRGEAGVNADYSQRLMAPAGSASFGLSVHGVLDMTRDGLTDVAVSALLQCRPLLMNALLQCRPLLVSALLQCRPLLVSALLQCRPLLVSALLQCHPLLVSALLQCRPLQVSALLQCRPLQVSALLQCHPLLVSALLQCRPLLVSALLQCRPLLVSALLQCRPLLVNALLQGRPLLVSALLQGRPLLVSALLQCRPLQVSALLQGRPLLVSALLQGRPLLVSALLQCRPLQVSALLQCRPLLVSAVLQCRPLLVSALLQGRPLLVSALLQCRPLQVSALLQCRPLQVNALLQGRPLLVSALLQGRPLLVSALLQGRPLLVSALLQGRPLQVSALLQGRPLQ